MTGILAVLALHSCGVFEQFSTKRTAHNTVELLRNESVSVLFQNLFFTLSYSTFTAKPKVKLRLASVLFG